MQGFYKTCGVPADKHLQLFFVWLRVIRQLFASLTAGKTPRTRPVDFDFGLRSAIRVAGGQLLSAAKIWIGIDSWVTVVRDAYIPPTTKGEPIFIANLYSPRARLTTISVHALLSPLFTEKRNVSLGTYRPWGESRIHQIMN